MLLEPLLVDMEKLFSRDVLRTRTQPPDAMQFCVCIKTHKSSFSLKGDANRLVLERKTKVSNLMTSFLRF